MRRLLMMVFPALLVACAPKNPTTSGSGADAAALGRDTVILEAAMSHMGLQHPMSSDPALRDKAVSYVVVDGSEVTVYADTRVSCPASVRLAGKWTSASGDKGGQHVVDRQLAAVRWECIP